MRLIHTSDLHIGRDFENSSLESVQLEFLDWLIGQVEEQGADALIIAGDVWDKHTPSKDAVRALTAFFDKLDALGIDTFVIAGNHDTAARLAFRGEPGDARSVRVFAEDEQYPTPFTLTKNGETVHIVAIPYIDPPRYQTPRPDAEGNPRPRTHQTMLEDAVAVARERLAELPAAPTIAIAHAYVRGASPTDSERRIVGNADMVNAEIFAGFSYVALGHLHRPQLIDGSNAIAYSGSPIPYSFSEAHPKSIRVVDISPDGSVAASLVTVPMGRPVIVLTDTMENLLHSDQYMGYTGHWVSVKLRDTEIQADPKQRLAVRFPYVVSIAYARDQAPNADQESDNCCAAPAAERTPEQVIAEFVLDVAGRPLTSPEAEIVQAALIDARKAVQG